MIKAIALAVVLTFLPNSPAVASMPGDHARTNIKVVSAVGGGLNYFCSHKTSAKLRFAEPGKTTRKNCGTGNFMDILIRPHTDLNCTQVKENWNMIQHNGTNAFMRIHFYSHAGRFRCLTYEN